MVQSNSKVEMIHGDKYYETYEDVFGETSMGDNALFNDYGQLWNLDNSSNTILRHL